MPARADRLAEFETAAEPPPDSVVELLCEDHVGTFLLPFLCRSTPEGFKNDGTGERIEADVVGWRKPKERHSASARWPLSRLLLSSGERS